MSEMPYQPPERLTVTSGLNPLVDIDLLGPNGKAWMMLDLVKLSVPPLIVDNRTPPGVDGSTALQVALNELRSSHRFLITGTIDADGNPTTVGAEAQFRRHWVYLCQHLFIPSGNATLDAVYQSPDEDEDEIEFQIQFDTPELPTTSSMWPTDWVTTLQVVLPGGPLIPSGVA